MRKVITTTFKGVIDGVLDERDNINVNDRQSLAGRRTTRLFSISTKSWIATTTSGGSS